MKKLFLLLMVVALGAQAEIQKRPLEYKQGETVLEGYYVYDDARSGPRPGVLVAHQWKGLTEYEKQRAEMLAKMGYAVLAVDIYGKGVRPNNPKDAGAMAGKYKGDRALLRARAQAGLDTLKKQKEVDPKHLAAIGYCFGGTTVLELARSGADVLGVVSFHGALDNPNASETKSIKAKVLALHGADDPFVPPAQVSAFEDEMRQAKADWQLVKYGNAVHSFTEVAAGNDNSKGAAYNEKADRRSWEAMKVFFAELFH